MVDNIDFDNDVDHYVVLGLPSGGEGAKLTQKEISRAYKLLALELHPDKRPNDPNAHTNFLKLKQSYDVLTDETKRKLFDDAVRARRKRKDQADHHDLKRRKMASEMQQREEEARERMASEMRQREEEARERIRKAREEAERIAKELEEERTRIRNKKVVVEIDKTRILKVWWEKKPGEEYNEAILDMIFSPFGKVEDVVVRSGKNKGSALVTMESTVAAMVAANGVSDDPYNPIQAEPLQRKNTNILFSGLGYRAYDNSVLEMIRQNTLWQTGSSEFPE